VLEGCDGAGAGAIGSHESLDPFIFGLPWRMVVEAFSVEFS